MEPCRCEAYRFPHRPGSGQCAGGKYRCCACGAYFDEYHKKTIYGRVGHIDNWMPDETLEWCPVCNEEGSIEESRL